FTTTSGAASGVYVAAEGSIASTRSGNPSAVGGPSGCATKNVGSSTLGTCTSSTCADALTGALSSGTNTRRPAIAAALSTSRAPSSARSATSTGVSSSGGRDAMEGPRISLDGSPGQ